MRMTEKQMRDLIKYKRQVRDWYNKHVHSYKTIRKVAEVINLNNAKESVND